MVSQQKLTDQLDNKMSIICQGFLPIFQLYIDGWGYKRIANHLTDQGIPTKPSWTIAPSPSPGHNEQSGAETTIEA